MSVSAVQNFYLHVNEKWLNDPMNAIPEEYSSWGGFVRLADQNIANQLTIINELLVQQFDDLDEEQKKIVSIWNASNKRFESWDNDKYDIRPIQEELDILKILLDKNQVSDPEVYARNLGYYLHHTQINGLTNLMNIDKGSSPLDSNHVMMDIAPSGLSLPSREYYTDDRQKDLRDQYIDHLNKVSDIVQMMGITLNTDFAQNIIEFEKKIAHIMMKKEHSRMYDEYMTITPLEGIYDQMDKLKYLPQKLDQYNGDELKVEQSTEYLRQVKIFMDTVYESFDIRNILQKNYVKSFPDNDPNKWNQIIVYDGDYFQRIFKIMFNPLNYKQMMDYYYYQVIRSRQSFVDKKLNDEMFDFYSKKLGGQLKQKSRDKRSIQAVNGYAKEMMGKIYVKKYFSETSKQDLNQMIERVLCVMKESLNQSNWLTEPTKVNAIKKLDRFVKKIGYPDQWKDYSDLMIKNGDSIYDHMKAYQKWKIKHSFYNKINCVLDRTEWLMTPHTVNAYFMPPQNEIVFPAAILQPPFYYDHTFDIDKLEFDIHEEINTLNEIKIDQKQLLIASNYGGIGAVIAHEITHGYDDMGSKYDMNGNINNWWTDQDKLLFNKQIEIMLRQSNKYQYIDLETKSIYHMNGKLTLGENLADLGGMSLSLKAMHRLIDEKHTNHLYKNAMTRVFFKSFANIWKQNTKKEALINRLINDPHAPNDFRGNMVKNIDEFHIAFGTTPNDMMWLDESDRVRMW